MTNTRRAFGLGQALQVILKQGSRASGFGFDQFKCQKKLLWGHLGAPRTDDPDLGRSQRGEVAWLFKEFNGRATISLRSVEEWSKELLGDALQVSLHAPGSLTSEIFYRWGPGKPTWGPEKRWIRPPTWGPGKYIGNVDDLGLPHGYGRYRAKEWKDSSVHGLWSDGEIITGVRIKDSGEVMCTWEGGYMFDYGMKQQTWEGDYMHGMYTMEGGYKSDHRMNEHTWESGDGADAAGYAMNGYTREAGDSLDPYGDHEHTWHGGFEHVDFGMNVGRPVF